MTQHKRRGTLARKARRITAQVRQEARDSRSNEEQAALLTERRGHSFKETARLLTA